MQKFWISLVFSAVAVTVSAQSLTVASMDSIAYVNSHSGIQATAHIAVTNTSNASKDYQVIRRKVGTTGLVDSNYFCWDLCYPVWANQSQGSVTVGAGATANDFSGYAYVRDSSANGQDTIWYTFVNVADASDSLQVPVVYAFNRYVSTPEAAPAALRLFPVPARAGQRIYGLPQNAVQVTWIDVLGRTAATVRVAADGSVPAPAARGIWMAQVQLPSGIQTMKISVY
ncbi:MAG: hypothetical protein ACO31C_01355 [Schleiferiaceae bacterium]|jgi:hypothetical protein